MYKKQKNSFLQHSLKKVSPEMIDRMVNLAMNKKSSSNDVFVPSYGSECLMGIDYKYEFGYGRDGFKKLVDDLASKNSDTRLHAIYALMDMVICPKKACLLIQIQVIDQLTSLILWEISDIRRKICKIFENVANIYQGRIAIINNNKTMKCLINIIQFDSDEDVRFAASKAIKALAGNFLCAKIMTNKFGMIKILLNCIIKETDECIEQHLNTLETLIQWNQQSAIDNKGIEIIITIIKSDLNNGPKIAATVCLSILLQYVESKVAPFDSDDKTMIDAIDKLISA